MITFSSALAAYKPAPLFGNRPASGCQAQNAAPADRVTFSKGRSQYDDLSAACQQVLQQPRLMRQLIEELQSTSLVPKNDDQNGKGGGSAGPQGRWQDPDVDPRLLAMDPIELRRMTPEDFERLGITPPKDDLLTRLEGGEVAPPPPDEWMQQILDERSGAARSKGNPEDPIEQDLARQRHEASLPQAVRLVRDALDILDDHLNALRTKHPKRLETLFSAEVDGQLGFRPVAPEDDLAFLQARKAAQSPDSWRKKPGRWQETAPQPQAPLNDDSQPASFLEEMDRFSERRMERTLGLKPDFMPSVVRHLATLATLSEVTDQLPTLHGKGI